MVATQFENTTDQVWEEYKWKINQYMQMSTDLQEIILIWKRLHTEKVGMVTWDSFWKATSSWVIFNNKANFNILS